MHHRLDGYGRALANRGFRRLLLAVAALAIVPDFLWNTLVAAWLGPDDRYADLAVFQQAAARLRDGADPYLDFVTRLPGDPVRNSTYVYPPFLAWLLQPVADLRGVGRVLLVTGLDYLFLALALVFVLRALRVRDRQAWALAALLAMGFFPVVDNFFWGQVGLLLLALGAAWFWSYVEGAGWPGAVALGVGSALKLVQAPLALAYVAERRWREVGVSVVAGAGVLLLGARWLPEWAARVFPALSGGTGWMGNLAPTGVLLRLADPGSFGSRALVTVGWVRVAGLLVAAAVLGVSLAVGWRGGGSEAGARGEAAGAWRRVRAGRGALLIAALPLVSPITWGGHLALQLVPLVVVGWLCIGERRWWPLLVAIVAVALMGPAGAAYWRLAGSGALSYSPWARPFAELGAVGVALNWVAVVLAVGGARGRGGDDGESGRRNPRPAPRSGYAAGIAEAAAGPAAQAP